MPYMRHSEAQQISPDELQMLARLVGLTIPPEDIEPLGRALADQLASIALLERLDLAGVDPVLTFDPRWGDHTAPISRGWHAPGAPSATGGAQPVPGGQPPSGGQAT